MPPLWAGQTCAIFAGGPSLTQADVDRCRGLRTIAINNSHELAPWADILYFCDARWHDWHREAVEAFAGLVVTLENYEIPGVKHLHNMGRDGLHLDTPDGVCTGRNSGIQAINLAVHLGARRILLLGYDMRTHGERTHWHGGHPRPNAPKHYEVMRPCFATLPPFLERAGVEVINCTPGSAIDVFPITTVEAAIADGILDPA